MKHWIVAQGLDPAVDSLAGALNTALAGQGYDRLDVAVAYATRAGVKALEAAAGGLPPVTRWVIGLDDAISEPELLDDLLKAASAELRVVALAPQRRFHPKLYCFWSQAAADRCLLVTGSANMTQRGFEKNGEAAVILSAESVAEAVELKVAWEQMWLLGQAMTGPDLAAYSLTHAKAKAARKTVEALGVAPPPDPAPAQPLVLVPVPNGNPIQAHGAWLEAGTPSAGGRDLEFPKAMMPFFGIQPGSPSPTTRRFRLPGGRVETMIFTERTDNQMWRLMFSTEVTEAIVGRNSLRPPGSKQTRSDLTVCFERTTGGADFTLKLVPIGGPDHAALKAMSTQAKGLHHTRNPGGRFFGFY